MIPDGRGGLHGWGLEFAGRTPGCVPSATFFPEPAADSYVERALTAGARVFKAHLQVGGYDPRDGPRSKPAELPGRDGGMQIRSRDFH